MSKATTSPSQSFIDIAKRVIAIELKAISDLSERLDDSFTAACAIILDSTGRVIITGMGKSGHISNKMAATLASTGTPAYFVHPGEALHGDLGMILPEDVVIVISNSGSTEELLILASATKRHGTKIIAMTGDEQSPLAELSDIHLNIHVDEEACPLGLAPTSSTTVTLVLGDALAVALLEARGFTTEDFARSHPAGRLGKRLLVHVENIMHTGDQLPVVSPDSSIKDAILEITSKKLGATLICDRQQTLLGIFTDGDLRRVFEHDLEQSLDQNLDKSLDNNIDQGIKQNIKQRVNNDKIGDIVSKCHYTAHSHDLAVDALTLMQEKEITVLPVVDDKGQVAGIIHMHDLLKAGIV